MCGDKNPQLALAYCTYVNSDECDARYGISCYVFVSTPLTWEGARSRCLLEGGHLATIDSQAENDVVQQTAISKFYIFRRIQILNFKVVYNSFEIMSKENRT